MSRVIETAKAINIPINQQLLLHIVPQEFIVDHQYNIQEPIGMSGIRLEVKVHIVTGAVTAVQNIIKCIHSCNVKISDLILQSIASTDSVLMIDKREFGVILIDIGGGTTDVAIFSEGAIRYTTIIPIAGDKITNDIAIALRTSTLKAEEIKLRYGIAKQILANFEEILKIPGISDDDRNNTLVLSPQELSAVIEPRVEELFTLVNQVIRNSGYEKVLSSGIVLTGGSTMMSGILRLAEDIFLKPTRLGILKYSGQLSDTICHPNYSTALGLILKAKNQYLRKFIITRKKI